MAWKYLIPLSRNEFFEASKNNKNDIIETRLLLDLTEIYFSKAAVVPWEIKKLTLGY